MSSLETTVLSLNNNELNYKLNERFKLTVGVNMDVNGWARTPAPPTGTTYSLHY